MQEKSLAALQFVADSKKKLTVEQFTVKFGEEVLQSVLVSHVDDVKGKIELNEAGKSIVAGLK